MVNHSGGGSGALTTSGVSGSATLSMGAAGKGESGLSGGSTAVASGYSLHQLQGNKQHGMMRSGFLLKKSDGKMRKVWQKRKCQVRFYFCLSQFLNKYIPQLISN